MCPLRKFTVTLFALQIAIIRSEDGDHRRADNSSGIFTQSGQGREKKVHFHWYYRKRGPITSAVGDARLFNGQFDKDKPTIVLIPGNLNAPPSSQIANYTRNGDHRRADNSSGIFTQSGHGQEKKVHFHLYNRKQGPIISEVEDARLFNGQFDKDKPTIFLLPGYLNAPSTSQFANYTRDAYLAVYDGQVIVAFCDAEFGNFTEARSNITNIGVVVAQFWTRMVSEEGLSVMNTPILGYSLGAHIAGTAGKLLNGKLGTIVGLDPARILFVSGGRDTLSEDSASFVMNIHTSSTVEGILEPIGHVDFYVNGGLPPQPGCEDLRYFTWSVCSHAASFTLYAESFKYPHDLLATKCCCYEKFQVGDCNMNEKIYMGINTPQSARGIYFLRTRSNSPYGLGVSGSIGEGSVAELTPLNTTQTHSVHFWLMNRKRWKSPIRSKLTDGRLFGGAYNSHKPTIALISGFGDTRKMSMFIDQLVEAFLMQGDYELLAVYWDAATADYRVAVAQSVNIARVISQFLERMVNEENLDLSSLTVIGYDCGAHIGGTAGRFVQGKFKTFVGLDPPGALFIPGGYNVMDRNSADFVMVIHTSASAPGIIHPLGHVDFYPNTGIPPQPGCESLDYMFPVSPVSALCSHLRAIYLYTESIRNPKAFPATECNSYEEATDGACSGCPPTTVYMGHNTSRSARGVYYLRTRGSSPYSDSDK